ncbi:hypothetical protein UlMin_023230 [Ulmus minor]
MAAKCLNSIAMRLCLALFIAIFIAPNLILAKNTQEIRCLRMNAIDRCWRANPNWRRNRQQLARCAVGYSGKMTGNIGRGLVRYKVIDPSDNPVKPKPGTLRYGATIIGGKLEKPLLISSFTAIDGRGVSVSIAGNACLRVFEANNVIIHGLQIHHCRAQPASLVMGHDGRIVNLGQVDGDAIRLISASKVWIDHNTLYQCQDGLLDVTRGSTDITVSNNWFRDQDKVMLLGHDDGYLRDKNMKVTVVYNHFGPNCNQRMPRVRFGYAHVVNNLYQKWAQYAIGGSMNPSVKSEANLFIASKSGKKEKSWRFYSVRDTFENGASFIQTGFGGAKPNYNRQQSFPVVDAQSVRSLTRSTGVLRCTQKSIC